MTKAMVSLEENDVLVGVIRGESRLLSPKEGDLEGTPVRCLDSRDDLNAMDVAHRRAGHQDPPSECPRPHGDGGGNFF